MFIMFDFISLSILAKKREIGVFCALGARVIDVFEIFMTELLTIAFFVLSYPVLEV